MSIFKSLFCSPGCSDPALMENYKQQLLKMKMSGMKTFEVDFDTPSNIDCLTAAAELCGFKYEKSPQKSITRYQKDSYNWKETVEVIPIKVYLQ